jgi:hypothetical protein
MVLVPLVYCAKTVVGPVVLEDCTHIGSTAFSTVRIPAVPVCQVTLAVTSTCSPPAVAMAVKQSPPDAVVSTGRLKEVIPFGPRTMLVTFAKVTVAVVVAVAVPDAAVIVLVPAATAVNRPPVVSVATVGSELDQQTVVPVQLVPAVKVSGFPLLSVPAAVNCTGAPPMLTVGFGGSMVMAVTVGFTKNPLQATPVARITSVATAPIRRSFCLRDVIDLKLLGSAC